MKTTQKMNQTIQKKKKQQSKRSLLHQMKSHLMNLKSKIERGKDMMVKLYVISIMNGEYEFKNVPNVLKKRVRKLLEQTLEDKELLAELTKE